MNSPQIAVCVAAGGRGRGGRSGSGNLGASFLEARDFEQMSNAMYYIAASPPAYNSFNTSQTPGGLKYVPSPREQGACDSCVGQAAAAAVQMSLAYTTRQPVERFNVSARALYYCVAGGRTCKTGGHADVALQQQLQLQHCCVLMLCAGLMVQRGICTG
jgi:hypothetical protein